MNCCSQWDTCCPGSQCCCRNRSMAVRNPGASSTMKSTSLSPGSGSPERMSPSSVPKVTAWGMPQAASLLCTLSMACLRRFGWVCCFFTRSSTPRESACRRSVSYSCDMGLRGCTLRDRRSTTWASPQSTRSVVSAQPFRPGTRALSHSVINLSSVPSPVQLGVCLQNLTHNGL